MEDKMQNFLIHLNLKYGNLGFLSNLKERKFSQTMYSRTYIHDIDRNINIIIDNFMSVLTWLVCIGISELSCLT